MNNMRFLFYSFLSFFLYSLFLNISFAESFSRATIDHVYELRNTESPVDGYQEIQQSVTLTAESGERMTLDHNSKKLLQTGDRVIIRQNLESEPWYIADYFRLPQLFLIFLVFVIFGIWITGWRALLAIGGLLFGIFILTFFVAPAILDGKDPVVYASIGAVLIAFVSMYLAHGFNPRTHIALFTTILSIFAAVIISYIFVWFSRLSGTGTEDAMYLQMGTNAELNLQGILLAGIIIGTLGVLDDITSTQVTAISELKKTNSKISFTQLFQSGMNIGREHVFSMINTLALAYFGAAFPLFLLLALPYAQEQSLWISLNSASISEEIVRTLAGSLSLMLAVPLSTFIAAWFYSRYNKRPHPSPA